MLRRERRRIYLWYDHSLEPERFSKEPYIWNNPVGISNSHGDPYVLATFDPQS